MANYLVTDSDLSTVASAIRTKGGTSAQLSFPSGFVNAIGDIQTGGSAVLINKNITTNGTYNASSDSADGYKKVVVSVQPSLTTKNISANGTYAASGDNADGYSSVTVSVANSYAAGDEGKVVSNGALVSQSSQNIDTNGTYDTTLKNQVVVNVQGGGGITTLEVIQELTLTENTRAVKVDIPSGYDWVYMLVKGQFVSSNWLYWGLNTTSGSNYQPETTALQTGFCATNATSDGNGRMFGVGQNGNTYTQSASDPMSYLHVRGYNKDIKAGTKIFTYGGKYANL